MSEESLKITKPILNVIKTKKLTSKYVKLVQARYHRFKRIKPFMYRRFLQLSRSHFNRLEKARITAQKELTLLKSNNIVESDESGESVRATKIILRNDIVLPNNLSK